MATTPFSSGEDEPQFLSVQDIALWLSLTDQTVRRLLTTGQMCSYVKIGRLIRVRRSDFEAWIGTRVADSTSTPLSRQL
ncbi:MAG: helix-turn-helix domain-containing protein [Planctomycetota bacterium]